MFDEQPDGDIHGECAEEIHRLEAIIRQLCSIIESEYPEDDERYQFAMNCLTDVGEE